MATATVDRAAVRPSFVEGGYIAGRLYDWVFFILAPLWALLIGWLVAVTGLDKLRYSQTDASGALRQIAVVALVSAAFTHAHLVIVFFRTHLNGEIFRRHPHRFVTVPLVLLFASIASRWVFVAASVLAVWWDVYHSSLQTFGLGRIYDRRAGNDANVGRRADYVFNLLLYAGPVLAGVNLWAHLKSLRTFDAVDPSISEIADAVMMRSGGLTATVVAAGVVLGAVFVVHYARLVRQGYVIPVQKGVLYLVTGFVSIACWGFGSFGEAFLIMNFFHALQYFAIVWWSEKSNLMQAFRCSAAPALAILVVLGLGYGFWRAHRPDDYVAFVALGNVVSLMHFWYDGFVWSVRKGHV